MSDYTRKHWLSIRGNGGSLQKFYRSRGNVIWHSNGNQFGQRPQETCDLGRNKAKRARRAAERSLRTNNR